MKKILLFLSACLFAFAASAESIVLETTGAEGQSTAEYALEDFSIEEGELFVLTAELSSSVDLTKAQVMLFNGESNVFDWGSSSLNNWSSSQTAGTSFGGTFFMTALMTCERGDYTLQFIAGADAATLTFTKLSYEIKPAGTLWYGSEDVVAWGQLSKKLSVADIPETGYVAVSYTGETAPGVALVNSSWTDGCWTNANADAVIDGIAYISKAGLDAAWESKKEEFGDYATIMIAAGSAAVTITNISIVSELPSVKNKIVMNANSTYNYQSAGIPLGLSEAPAVGDTVELSLTNVTISNDVDAIQVFLVEQGADNDWAWNVVSNYSVAMESPKAADAAIAEVKVKVIIEKAITYPGIVSAYVATTNAPIESVESVTLFYDEKDVTVIKGSEVGPEPTAVEDVNASSFTIVNGEVISAGEIVVYNIAGQVVATANQVLEVASLPAGVNIITAAEGVIKFIK